MKCIKGEVKPTLGQMEVLSLGHNRLNHLDVTQNLNFEILQNHVTIELSAFNHNSS
ncbi:hypothetical protein TanjilG_28618 [Lupinus angustifolius]|uniref:Uncharacterized protein n=1 Tax=Lupinus angustifolius TaxID=3871 RepID=A0A4P1RJK2_LUPAN|nr:hypothetical protein TanjilG_28618 [Lupinus angustifolius]